MAEEDDPAAAAAAKAAAAERKRKRLEAWRKRQAAAAAASASGAATAPTAVGQQAAPPAPAPPPRARVKVSLGLGFAGKKKKKKSKKKNNKMKLAVPVADLGAGEDEEDEDDDREEEKKVDPALEWVPTTTSATDQSAAVSVSTSTTVESTAQDEDGESSSRPKKRSRRWDTGAVDTTAAATTAASAATATDQDSAANQASVDDALDKFMDQLEAGATGQVSALSINVGGSMQISGSMTTKTTTISKKQNMTSPIAPVASSSGGVITAEELAKLHGRKRKMTEDSTAATDTADAATKGGGEDNVGSNKPIFTHSDWESDANAKQSGMESASEAETDNEEEEKARRAFLEALKKSAPIATDAAAEAQKQAAAAAAAPQIKSEVMSEKHRREAQIRRLESEAMTARKKAHALSEAEFGRMYNDDEGGVMEEAERNLGVLTAAPDALEVLAELNKKKELKAVDHSAIDYIQIRKNLFVVPRSLANMSANAIEERRAELHIRARGRGAPAPVSTFRECGLSERIMSVLDSQGIKEPFPVQAQCMPCIMAGRDVIGIAKTGSGKTLAYLLPLLRHIMDQPPLQPGESGPIGLVLAPARELAFQIHIVCKVFAKQLGINKYLNGLSQYRSLPLHSRNGSTAVYGGAGVAEQIGDLKRGTHIAVATPGRMIDILTMQSGKILSLQRVSYVVMDEADRMFDMGFAPQISAILSAVRPDRQTVLFSATFPKAVETLAKKSLKYPIEVLVGGRSVASDSVTQYGEVIEEEDKFLRLLQLLGEHVNDDEKVIVFVDTQVRADNIFEQLLSTGYPSLSLHGGKEQEDRDSTISDFKRADGPNVLVATSVAGRGLDVPSCRCVVNYSAPNHLEDYVHRVGRTGRAGKKGTAYTFVNSGDEAKFAPSVVRAMIEAGQSKNISSELRALSDSFKEKVKKGEAKRAGSGFKGKGYTYDSSELNDAQKLARMEKRQALIDAGMIDPDDEEPGIGMDAADEDMAKSEAMGKEVTAAAKDQALQATKLSSELLALPGMHDMVMKKAGFAANEGQDGEPDSASGIRKTGDNHYISEIEINDYPQQARWKVTQKETTSRLQDDFQTAVTLKGEYFGANRTPAEGERKLYLHLEAISEHILKNGMHEIRRLLNEETLRVGNRGGGGVGHKYSVL